MKGLVEQTRWTTGHPALGVWSSIWMAVALSCGLAACSKPQPAVIVRPGPVDTRQDPQLDSSDLLRDLEATMLDNYLQLTLGNMEAYADSIARNREVVMIGIAPDDLVYGVNPARVNEDRRPFRELARPICGRPAAASSRLEPDGQTLPKTGPPAPSGDPSRQETGTAEGPAGQAPVVPSDPDSNGNTQDRTDAADAGDPSHCARILSKTLDLHLHDESVGWIADELDYRVWHDGREAAFPLRFTAVVVRDIDRWVIAMEHTSYVMTMQNFLAMARKNALARPHKLPTERTERGRTQRLLNLAIQQLTRDRKATARHALEMARKYGKQAPPGNGDRLDRNLYLILWPFQGSEFHGPQTFDALSLAEILKQELGLAPRITIEDYRMVMAENQKVAWMAATVRVKLAPPGPGSQSGPRLDFRLRGTFVFAVDSSGWNLVQTHLSVPIKEDQLAADIFGPVNLGAVQVSQP